MEKVSHLRCGCKQSIIVMFMSTAILVQTITVSLHVRDLQLSHGLALAVCCAGTAPPVTLLRVSVCSSTCVVPDDWDPSSWNVPAGAGHDHSGVWHDCLLAEQVATCPRWTFCEQGFDFHGTVANEEITL
jgi:hypothetical protein